MARVTVEDCVDKVSNRFDLILFAAQRARQISSGADLTIDRDRDKNPVVALREIAETTVKPNELEEAIVTSLQRVRIDVWSRGAILQRCAKQRAVRECDLEWMRHGRVQSACVPRVMIFSGSLSGRSLPRADRSLIISPMLG